MANLEFGFHNGRITFDSINETYYAGQIVSGKLEFKLDSPLTINNICVKYLGEAVVNWSEYETMEYNGESRKYLVPYNGREEFFNFIQYVAGGNPGLSTTLSPGTHVYQFRYQTPFVCPSSFEGDKGKVWYRVIASLDSPSIRPSPDLEVIKIFQMVAPLDLNDDADAMRPINLEFEEIYSCCMCESGPLLLQVQIPFSGYCPGQRIPVKVTVDNKSNVEVKKLVFSLRKTATYHSQQPPSAYEVPEEVLATVKKGLMASATKAEFTVELEVPDMIAPNLDNCSLIDVGYSFKTEIEASGCNDGSEDDADIIIGLIPIRATQENYVHPMKDSLPVGPVPKPETYPVGTATVAPSDGAFAKHIGFVDDAQQIRYPGYPYPGTNERDPPPYSAVLTYPAPNSANLGFGDSSYQPPGVTPTTAPSAPPC